MSDARFVPKCYSRPRRAAGVRLPDAPEPLLIVHWKLPVERCPSCDADLKAHAHERAVAEALAEQASDDQPPQRVFFWDGLTTWRAAARRCREGTVAARGARVNGPDLEVVWPLHRWHYLSVPEPGRVNLEAVEESLSPIVVRPAEAHGLSLDRAR